MTFAEEEEDACYLDVDHKKNWITENCFILMLDRLTKTVNMNPQERKKLEDERLYLFDDHSILTELVRFELTSNTE